MGCCVSSMINQKKTEITSNLKDDNQNEEKENEILNYNSNYNKKFIKNK